MRSATFILFIICSSVFVRAQGGPPPPPPGGKTQPITQHKLTPEQVAKRVDFTCPIKGKFTVNYKAVGGAVIDKDVTIDKGGEARYCLQLADLAFCNQNNPTPEIPCKYIEGNPMSMSALECPLASSKNTLIPKSKSIGLWELTSNTNIVFNVFLCNREWKLDMCRYRKQETAVTIFKNAGLFSVDRKVTSTFSVCEVDQQAEKEFQARLTKSKDTLIGLFQIKRKIWDGKCPAGNKQCLAKVTELAIKAQLEAQKMLAREYDADAVATMKYVAVIHDPIIAATVKTFK